MKSSEHEKIPAVQAQCDIARPFHNPSLCSNRVPNDGAVKHVKAQVNTQWLTYMYMCM